MIIGEGVRLRSPERTDIPKFVEWLNDPDVRTGLLLYLPLSLDAEQKWFDNMLTMPAEEQPLVIEIQDQDEWKMIGNIGLHKIDQRCRSAEVGIFIGEKSLWNQGYGTKAMQLILKHGFETLNLNRIMLDVFADNLGAIRAYEKCGFVHEGRKREAAYKNGIYVDILIMGILRSEWKIEDV
jgi:RimJ/RimL family protein N-acetyltransferase